MKASDSKKAREGLEKGLVKLVEYLSKKLDSDEGLTDNELRVFVSLCDKNKVTIELTEGDPDVIDRALQDLDGFDMDNLYNVSFKAK